MVITLLIILIPLAFIAGGFIAYKGVQLGLRWQVEVKKEQTPTMKPIPNPIAPIVEVVQEKQQVKHQEEVKSVFNEWVNGPEESR